MSTPIPISSLTAASAIDDDTVLPVVQTGSTKKATGANIKAFIAAHTDSLYPAKAAGNFADIPAAGDNNNAFYYAEDYDALYWSNGVRWFEMTVETTAGFEPTNLELPAISATSAEEGVTASCSSGVWNDEFASFVYSYQWRRDGANITGATSESYTFAAADVGTTITCAVTATTPFGDSDPVYSAGIGPIVAAGTGVDREYPVNTALPVITGTTTEGETLTCSTGTWTGSPTSYTYSWRRTSGGVTTILSSGASTSTRVLTSNDVGHTMTCVVTATNSVGFDSASSAATAAVTGTTVTVTPVTGGSVIGDVDASVSHTLGASDNLVVICVANESATAARTASTVTYGGVAATFGVGATADDGAGNYNRLELWYVLDASLPAAGANTAAVTWSGAVSDDNIVVASYVNAQQAAPQTASQPGLSAQFLSVALTPTHDTSLVVGGITVGNGNSIDVGPSGEQVSRYQVADSSSRTALGDILNAGTGGVAKTFQWAAPGPSNPWNRAVGACLAFGAAGTGTETPDPGTGERDIRKQPGHHQSFWNLPQAEAASTISAGFTTAALDGAGVKKVRAAHEIIVMESSANTTRNLYLNAQFDPAARENAGTLWRGVRADTPVLPAGTSTDYRPAAVVSTNGDVDSFMPFTDSDGVGDLYAGWQWPTPADAAYTDGSRNLWGELRGGNHPGSHLSVLGGCLRQWEIAAAGEVIRHALKISVDGARLSSTNSGYRWPAYQANPNYSNSASANHYSGSIPDVRMGSLVCVPWSHSKSSLGEMTDLVSRIYDALKTYGAYIVDLTLESGAYAFWTEFGFPGFTDAERTQLDGILQQLHVVTNNGSTTPGGGTLTSARRASLLPEVADPRDDDGTSNPPGAYTAQLIANDVYGGSGFPYRSSNDPDYGPPWGAHRLGATAVTPLGLNTSYDWYRGARPGTSIAGRYVTAWGQILWGGTSEPDPKVWNCRLQVRNHRLYQRINGTWTMLKTDDQGTTIEGPFWTGNYNSNGGAQITTEPSSRGGGTSVSMARMGKTEAAGRNRMFHWWWRGWYPRPAVPSGCDAIIVAAQLRLIHDTDSSLDLSALRYIASVGADSYISSTDTGERKPAMIQPVMKQVTDQWQWFTGINASDSGVTFTKAEILADGMTVPLAWMNAQ